MSDEEYRTLLKHLEGTAHEGELIMLVRELHARFHRLETEVKTMQGQLAKLADALSAHALMIREQRSAIAELQRAILPASRGEQVN